MKVLIVDDDSLTRQVFHQFLTERAFTTYMAENGLPALEVLRANNDITRILLDANMPEMDAFGMLKAIQADETLSKIDYEIHIISSWEKELILEKMGDNGINMGCVRNIMKKPVDMDMMAFALSI